MNISRLLWGVALDFSIKKSRNKNVSKYELDELDISLAFAKEAKKEFSDFLKGVVLFGSAARLLSRNEGKKDSDIDILILLDDVSITFTKEVIEAYKIISQKTVAKISPRIHITTLKFTTFWDMVRNGDPVAVNMLRDGVPLLDTGFFEPLQALLLRGQIRPTYESIWTYFNRAPETLTQSRRHLTHATIDLYWGVIDAAHAALMKQGCIPTSPENVANMIEEHLVKKQLCDQRYAEIMRFFYKLNKEIEYKSRHDVTGQEFEKWYVKAKMFIDKMRTIIKA